MGQIVAFALGRVKEVVCHVLPYYFDPTYVLLIPALLLAIYAQAKVQSTFRRYLHERSQVGMTGAEVARRLLDANGLYDVPVEITAGTLSDHYDPRTRRMRLSPQVYQSTSVAALGVAAHETGHAVQHDQNYIPLGITLICSLWPASALKWLSLCFHWPDYGLEYLDECRHLALLGGAGLSTYHFAR